MSNPVGASGPCVALLESRTEGIEWVHPPVGERGMQAHGSLFPTEARDAIDESDATLRWVVAQGIEMGRPSQLHVTAERRQNKIAEVRVAGHAVVACRGQIDVP